MSDRIQRDRRYAVTPEHLILDPRVSDRAFRLWCRLDRFAGNNGAAFPTRRTLSIELDCSRESIDRAIKELIATGWLTTQRREAGGSNIYTLTEAPVKATLSAYEQTKKAREEAWGKKKATADAKANVKPSSSQVSEGGVVTHDDRGGVVTHDDRCRHR